MMRVLVRFVALVLFVVVLLLSVVLVGCDTYDWIE